MIMKLYKHNIQNDIFEMSNARGKYIVRPHKLPFFFLSIFLQVQEYHAVLG